MIIKTLEVAGIGPAIMAMRHPYSNYHLSDTKHGMIGPADVALSDRLARAGGSHSKHLRMIQVWFEVWAPLYWWKEADTYKVGTVRLSTSTMHTITRAEFTKEGFSSNVDGATLQLLNLWRGQYLQESLRQRPSIGARSSRTCRPASFSAPPCCGAIRRCGAPTTTGRGIG